MLYDIEKPPTSSAAVIVLNPNDTVAIARVALPPNYEIDTNGKLRRPLSTDAARVEHAGELRNLAQQWALAWPPEQLTDRGKIVGYLLLDIERKIASYTNHARHQQDAARFYQLLSTSGYI